MGKTKHIFGLSLVIGVAACGEKVCLVTKGDVPLLREQHAILGGASAADSARQILRILPAGKYELLDHSYEKDYLIYTVRADSATVAYVKFDGRAVDGEKASCSL